MQQGVKNKLRFFKLNIILAKMEGWAAVINWGRIIDRSTFFYSWQNRLRARNLLEFSLSQMCVLTSGLGAERADPAAKAAGSRALIAGRKAAEQVIVQRAKAALWVDLLAALII